MMTALARKKFQEENLNRIEEAVRDMGISFGMAAVLSSTDVLTFYQIWTWSW